MKMPKQQENEGRKIKNPPNGSREGCESREMLKRGTYLAVQLLTLHWRGRGFDPWSRN